MSDKHVKSDSSFIRNVEVLIQEINSAQNLLPLQPKISWSLCVARVINISILKKFIYSDKKYHLGNKFAAGDLDF